MRPSVDATSQDIEVHEEISTGDSRGNLNEVSYGGSQLTRRDQ